MRIRDWYKSYVSNKIQFVEVEYDPTDAQDVAKYEEYVATTRAQEVATWGEAEDTLVVKLQINLEE